MSIPLALLVLATAAPPDADTLKARAAAVVSQKARMPNRYALTIRVEGRIPNAKPPLETQTSATYMIWRDGNKFRNDRLDVKHSPPRPSHIPGERHIGCENCEREGYGISTTVLPGSPPAQHMVEFKRLGTWSFDRYCNIFDWRYFGLRNDRQCGYERAHVATDFPALFDQPGGIRLEARGGQPCVVATKKATANKYERSVWLSEREEFNPVFFEESFEVKGDAERRTTEIDWQKTSGGHFFPKRAQTNSIITFEGDKYASEEIVTMYLFSDTSSNWRS